MLPTGQLSNIPWRRTGVKYTNNEAYFDVIEEIDAIVDKSGTKIHLLMEFINAGHKSGCFINIPVSFYCSGTTVFAEIQGVIEACVRLTGMPDLTLSFMVSVLLFYFLCICI